MFKGKTFIAIIPARGGSKRLPRKNVLDLAGRPLIAWTIQAARDAKYIDHIVVSTDDSEISGISKKFGAEVLIRPAELASDTASSVDVALHAIEAQARFYDYIVLLQPTSPLRTAKHIEEAIELLFEKSADAITSVCESTHCPLWANTLPEDGSMENFIRDEVKGKRSQDLPKYYQLNGAIYIVGVACLIGQKDLILNSGNYAYLMPPGCSVDIDDDLDFQFVNFLISKAEKGW